MTSIKEAHDAIRAEKETYMKNSFNGANWPFYFDMEKLKRELYLGLRNLQETVEEFKEIDSAEFAAHPAISGSYRPSSMHSSSTQFMEDMKFTRYANVLLIEVDYFAGYGVAFVAVPENPDDWDKSQHQTVPLKLRHWSFCMCKHDYETVGRRHCVTTYRCKECDWTYEVDSS